MNKTDISVIIPVHELDDITKQLYLNAIKSVERQNVRPDELVVVTPTGSEAETFVKAADYGEIKDIVTFVENAGETDFATQANLGISKSKSGWISILEYDDEYAAIWFKNVIEYREAHPNVGLFMPIIVDVDGGGQFIGFTNEAVWANAFSDEIGILDLNALLAYQNFNIDGIVIKKEHIEEFGGFKSSIKLTFIYEFLLRMAFKDVRIMTIPKFGYKHVNQRVNSLFANYKSSMDPLESRWWMSQAKKEYYFEKDRKINYTKQTV